MDGVIELTGKVYLDLTGKPSLRYFRGNRWIMMMYEYYRNIILTEAMKNP